MFNSAEFNTIGFNDVVDESGFRSTLVLLSHTDSGDVTILLSVLDADVVLESLLDSESVATLNSFLDGGVPVLESHLNSAEVIILKSYLEK